MCIYGYAGAWKSKWQQYCLGFRADVKNSSPEPYDGSSLGSVASVFDVRTHGIQGYNLATWISPKSSCIPEARLMHAAGHLLISINYCSISGSEKDSVDGLL